MSNDQLDLNQIVFDGLLWSKPSILLSGADVKYKDISFPQICASETIFEADDLYGTYRINTERDLPNPDTGQMQNYPAGTQCMFSFTDQKTTREPVVLRQTVGGQLPLADVSGKLADYGNAISLFYKQGEKFYRTLYSASQGAFEPPLELGSEIKVPFPPAPAWYRGITHLFAVVEGQNKIDHWANSRSNPAQFTKQTELNTVAQPVGLPSPATYQSMLCLGYYVKDSQTEKKAFKLRRYDGTNWSQELSIYPTPGSNDTIAANSNRPSLVALNGLLYCFYVGSSGLLRYRTYNGNSFNSRGHWTAAVVGAGDVDTAVRVRTTVSAVGVKTTTARLHCVYQSKTATQTDSATGG